MRIQGKYNEYLNKLGKYDLVILDEFLLKPTNETERSDLLELMEKGVTKNQLFSAASIHLMDGINHWMVVQSQMRYWIASSIPPI